jgi:hypothetical protein
MLCAIFESKFNFPSAGEPDCCRRENARAGAALAGVAPRSRG